MIDLDKLVKKYWVPLLIVAIIIIAVFPFSSLMAAYPLSDKGVRIADSSTCERFEGACYDQSIGMSESILSKVVGMTKLVDCGIVDNVCSCSNEYRSSTCVKQVWEVDSSGAVIPSEPYGGSGSGGGASDSAEADEDEPDAAPSSSQLQIPSSWKAIWEDNSVVIVIGIFFVLVLYMISKSRSGM